MTVSQQTPPSAGGFEVRHLPIADPAAEPLLRSLGEDYMARYGELAAGEMSSIPDGEFDPPDGAFVMLFENGEAVAGGAFRRYDDKTAEFKRIWTHPDHRRRGLARKVLVELEHAAAARGYARIYLTTGPRQPEAVGLYLTTAYTPLFDPENPPFAPLGFEKSLP
ncbi:GNAT family N-acetyltransferase [Yinghuangia soli]|uniref:GNAT family N-acetyltransferase n=1 Tax=Yinghuangia soli TaxID=2908204 RepID=A0AA41Q5M9_9ACTN|nr:GNAT family N-acetyltransferase [Yinghuangia soli]MCF2532009.1 GNAT family N-acetyltransferase [Yinghuangia soli]